MILETHGFIQSAHHLPKYKGKCSVNHGHTWAYYLKVACEKEKLVKGMIVDFSIFKELDHKNINEYVENPTAENILNFMVEKIKNFNPNAEIIILRLWEDVKSLINPMDLKYGKGEHITYEGY